MPLSIFGLISGIVFGLISDTIGFRTKHKRSVQVLNQEVQNKSRSFSLNILFVEKLRLYIITIITIFLAPASIMALWGGSIESIAEIVYWFSIFAHLLKSNKKPNMSWAFKKFELKYLLAKTIVGNHFFVNT